MANLDEATLEGVVFLGNTLGPFFLQDPRTGLAGAEFAAVAALDAQAAGAEWPFADEAEATRDLAMMVEGLAASRAMSEGGAFCGDDDLMWEYRRLFIGPGAKPAPPWGSVYTDRECVVFGDTTLELRAWMPRIWKNSFACTCSRGRGTSWTSWPKPPSTRSTRGLRA